MVLWKWVANAFYDYEDFIGAELCKTLVGEIMIYFL